jgi:hypothetical protein
VPPPRRAQCIGGTLSRLRLRALRRRRQLHPRTAGLTEADRDRLLRRPRTVLAASDVMHLLANKLAGLAGRALAPPLSLPRPLERCFSGMNYPLRFLSRGGWCKTNTGDRVVPKATARACTPALTATQTCRPRTPRRDDQKFLLTPRQFLPCKTFGLACAYCLKLLRD